MGNGSGIRLGGALLFFSFESNSRIIGCNLSRDLALKVKRLLSNDHRPIPVSATREKHSRDEAWCSVKQNSREFSDVASKIKLTVGQSPFDKILPIKTFGARWKITNACHVSRNIWDQFSINRLWKICSSSLLFFHRWLIVMRLRLVRKIIHRSFSIPFIRRWTKIEKNLSNRIYPIDPYANNPSSYSILSALIDTLEEPSRLSVPSTLCPSYTRATRRAWKRQRDNGGSHRRTCASRRMYARFIDLSL